MDQAKLKAQETLESISATRIVGRKIRRESTELDKRVSSLLNGYELSVPSEHLEPIPKVEEETMVDGFMEPPSTTANTIKPSRSNKSNSSVMKRNGDVRLQSARKMNINQTKLERGDAKQLNIDSQRRDSIKSKASGKVQKTR